MFESLRNSLTIDTGAPVVTPEILDEHLNRLVEERKLTRGEAKEVAQEIEDSRRLERVHL
jgi:polyhydroxyalkanoate synthesis regulator phasin